MSRSVPEWIGKDDDQRIPGRVYVRVFHRAGGCCEKCTHKISPGEGWDLDHAVPLVFGGEHRESNLQLLCIPCHDKKTGAEHMMRAKSDRIRARHIGIRKRRTIRSWRKFDGTIVRKGESQ